MLVDWVLATCELLSNWTLGDLERLSVATGADDDPGKSKWLATRPVFRWGGSMSDLEVRRALGLGAEGRSTTESLEIEICDLFVELEETDITSGSALGFAFDETEDCSVADEAAGLLLGPPILALCGCA